MRGSDAALSCGQNLCAPPCHSCCCRWRGCTGVRKARRVHKVHLTSASARCGLNPALCVRRTCRIFVGKWPNVSTNSSAAATQLIRPGRRTPGELPHGLVKGDMTGAEVPGQHHRRGHDAAGRADMRGYAAVGQADRRSRRRPRVDSRRRRMPGHDWAAIAEHLAEAVKGWFGASTAAIPTRCSDRLLRPSLSPRAVHRNSRRTGRTLRPIPRGGPGLRTGLRSRVVGVFRRSQMQRSRR